MDKSIIFRMLSSALLACSIICFGSEDKILDIQCNVSAPADKRSNYSTIQIFFTKKNEDYIASARFIASGEIEKTISDFSNMYDSTSPSKLKDIFTYRGKGLYEGYRGANSLCWMFKTYSGEKSSGKVESSDIRRIVDEYDYQNNRPVFLEMVERRRKPIEIIEPQGEEFYVKNIHHTGVTEKLLDMPECFVELRSDSIKLILNNGYGTRNEIYPYQTIIDPGHVRAIRDCIKLGKIFVIDAHGSMNKESGAYKVLGYKNNAYLHWDGWWPFLWKYVTELKGFDNPADVEPEKEIKLDLNKDWQQIAGYRRNKNIRDIFFIVAGLYATYYIFQDKIHEVLGK